jgi:N-acetylglutamate synthase-like GNAT family acetyltransferase
MGVRESNDTEIYEILYVFNESNCKFYRAIIPQEYFKEPVVSPEEMKEQMKKMTFYTFRIDGKIVGVAALEEKNKDLGQIHWMYVLPEYQRKGVGTKLIRHIESEIVKRNMSQLMVITAERAVWARDFYVNLDYELSDMTNTPEGGTVTFSKVFRPGQDTCL